jgi:predicted RND superfamily exporter protein
MALVGVKLNFFNFVALPTTFGIAVDYAINIFERGRKVSTGASSRGIAALGGDSPRSARLAQVHAALRSSGGAVFLCSLTTIIGYYTLVIADNRALVSFGKLAILGELTCVAASLLVLPATMLLAKNRGRAVRVL